MTNLIVIDFDGVIRINDEPAEGVFRAFNALEGRGYQLTIQTARNIKEVEKWLKKYGFRDIKVTNTKPEGACAYIDDRGLRFENWDETLKKFEKHPRNWGR